MNNYRYRGSYLLSGPSSLSQAVESVRWAEGACAARTDGLGLGDYLYVSDYLGNVRSTVALYSEATAAPGSVVLDYGIASAAIISTALPKNPNARGMTTGPLVTLRNNDALTLAHEIGHTLGLPDKPRGENSLMSAPAMPLQPSDVSELLNYCIGLRKNSLFQR